MQYLSARALRLLFHLSLLAVLLVVFLAATGSGGAPSGPYETTVSAFKVHSRRFQPQTGDRAVRRAVDAAFAGVPQRGAVLGDPEAPVTMQFLADPECAEARQFAIQLLPKLVRGWVLPGKLRIEYLGEVDETVWPAIFKGQQRAVMAAGRQGKLWQYLELFYHYQGPEFTRYAGNWFLEELAEEVPGMDIKRWVRDRRAEPVAHAVERDVEVAKARGITYTPAFLVGPTGGRLEPLVHFTLTEPLAFEAAFREALAS